MALYLLEPDEPGAAWAPFAGATPIASLPVGAWRMHERWARALGQAATGTIAAHVEGYHAAGGIPVVAAAAVVGPAWVVDATFAPKLPMRAVGTTRRLLHEGRAVAWRLDPGQRWEGPFTAGDGLVVEGRALRGAFDLVTAVEQFLFGDTLALLDDSGDPIPEGTIVLGSAAAISLRGATLEPGVVLDARKGGIVLERDVMVRSGTRIEGPARVRQGSWLLGGHFRHVSVGPHCRLHGEISSCAFTGYANKSHDGFLGHSVIGEWVNLGAGTIGSNLKNTYGPIRLDIGETRLETTRTNLGALIGDHVKTAIGTLLPTGAVIGTGANLFHGPRAPKYTPPFAWGGDSDEQMAVEAFIETAKRVMPRRDIVVDAATERSLRAVHRRLTE
jgi:UDP-N-acetylglucosamine diphosphorylase/glucosamine-1-phosphate N-acetyltransferase